MRAKVIAPNPRGLDGFCGRVGSVIGKVKRGDLWWVTLEFSDGKVEDFIQSRDERNELRMEVKASG